MKHRKSSPITLAVAAAALAGCSTLPELRTPLSGSTWRLVEMQSSDDAQGTTQPGNRDRYTIKFNADGSAYLQLDCNRGRTGWEASRTGASSGTLTFKPLASTRALCQDNGLGERLAQQLEYVRSYVIRDGQLNMSLYADGGILVWERTGQN
ncbi:META domain-containing protein [Porphyrobacter sp. GA68]|uniref:META domain-containing protein n=1 Tax=Porphyrobacter sp. GA68 TaxID=2883480 RepID=UPI001D1961B6|nr:META domain-containing protein [Porphyrobacter sp. GA68]